MHYLLGEPHTQFNREASIDAAGYNFGGVRPELHKRHEMDRILNKKEVKKIVEDTLQERDNCIVWDKLWILQQYKEMFETCEKETVRKSLLDSMAKISSMFGESAVGTGAGKGTGSAAKRARDNFNKRVGKMRQDKNTIEFPVKEGTNDED